MAPKRTAWVTTPLKLCKRIDWRDSIDAGEEVKAKSIHRMVGSGGGGRLVAPPGRPADGSSAS